MSFVQRRRFLWILLLAGAALAAVVAKATTLSHLGFEELAQQASAVARLRCLSSNAVRDGGEIWTETQFEVLEKAKGLLGGIITVRTLGGQADGLHSRVEGVPQFRTGEEVYLFLWGKYGQPFRVLGWSQGAFRIARNPQNGAAIVTQDSSAKFFDPQTRRFRQEGVRGVPLPAFQEKLRQALEPRGR